jgi:hypothetical protein
MTENIENLVDERLRALRGDIASVKEDAREIKTRLTGDESGIASLRRDATRQRRSRDGNRGAGLEL